MVWIYSLIQVHICFGHGSGLQPFSSKEERRYTKLLWLIEESIWKRRQRTEGREGYRSTDCQDVSGDFPSFPSTFILFSSKIAVMNFLEFLRIPSRSLGELHTCFEWQWLQCSFAVLFWSSLLTILWFSHALSLKRLLFWPWETQFTPALASQLSFLILALSWRQRLVHNICTPLQSWHILSNHF